MFEPDTSKPNGIDPVPSISVRLTRDVFNRLATATRESGITKTRLVRQMITHCLDDMDRSSEDME